MQRGSAGSDLGPVSRTTRDDPFDDDAFGFETSSDDLRGFRGYDEGWDEDDADLGWIDADFVSRRAALH